MGSKPSQDEYFSVIAECEKHFPVAEWRIDDVPVWPLLRNELKTALLMAPAASSDLSPAKKSAFNVFYNLLGQLIAPVSERLRSLSDWQHEIVTLSPTDTVFLGDSVSLDRINGAWRDRFCAPIMEALAAGGTTSLLVQPGVQRLPREQKTYSAKWAVTLGQIAPRFRRPLSSDLPAFDEASGFLRARGFDTALLERAVLERVGVRIAAMARHFEWILSRTDPLIGFVVSYYWDVGYAFNLACRRRKVLSVDIQHGAQDGRHEAYNLWNNLPAEGYSVLPAVFWNWSEDDARAINLWAEKLGTDRHRGLNGGNPQLASWSDDTAVQTRQFDARIADIKARMGGSFDILVALQDIDSYQPVWDRLADFIQASPPSWRWWLRRHPSPAYNRGSSTRKLLALARPRLNILDASNLPLPALLRNVDAVLSLMSSSAVEAAHFGHRAVFLTEDARMQFSDIFRKGDAEVITDPALLLDHLSALERARGPRHSSIAQPHLNQTITTLLEMAKAYRARK